MARAESTESRPRLRRPRRPRAAWRLQSHPRPPDANRAELPSMPNLVPGAILARRYRIESILGHGAMSLVVAARHIALGQRVAVKVFNAVMPPRECSMRF